MNNAKTRGLGLEPGNEGGHAVGRDPRKMTRAELEALGHRAMSPLAGLRARCIDCCAGSTHEVRLCTAVRCPSWPFRMGSSPWRAPLTEKQLAARREAGHRLALKRGNSASDPIPGVGSASAEASRRRSDGRPPP